MVSVYVPLVLSSDECKMVRYCHDCCSVKHMETDSHPIFLMVSYVLTLCYTMCWWCLFRVICCVCVGVVWSMFNVILISQSDHSMWTSADTFSCKLVRATCQIRPPICSWSFPDNYLCQWLWLLGHSYALGSRIGVQAAWQSKYNTNFETVPELFVVCVNL